MIFTGLAPRYIGETFSGEQKFIVHKQPTSERLHLFNFYAVDLFVDGQFPTHADIADGFKIDPAMIVGGGRIKRPSLSEMALYSSSRYGAIPQRFLEFFKQDILRSYHQKFPDITSVVINTVKTTENDEKFAFLNEFNIK